MKVFNVPIADDDVKVGGPTIVRLASGRKALLFRDENGVRAFSEVCPHMGADLTEGSMCDSRVVCKWHGYLFSSETGAFVENPSLKTTALIRKKSESFDPEKRPTFKLQRLEVVPSPGGFQILEVGGDEPPQGDR